MVAITRHPGFAVTQTDPVSTFSPAAPCGRLVGMGSNRDRVAALGSAAYRATAATTNTSHAAIARHGRRALQRPIVATERIDLGLDVNDLVRGDAVELRHVAVGVADEQLFDLRRIS